MVKVLFCRERWANGNSENGPADTRYMESTLDAHGLGESFIFYYDTAENPDAELLAMIQAVKPHLVVLWPMVKFAGNIKRETLTTIKELDGIKLIANWGDGVTPTVVDAADDISAIVDLNVFLDTRKQHERWTHYPERSIGLYAPCDPRKCFVDPNKPRTIQVSFIGTTIGRALRLNCLYSLLANGVPVCKLGGRNEEPILHEKMVDILQRSHIGLNFGDAESTMRFGVDTQAVGEFFATFRHYTGRVAEITMCGAALFDLANEETSNIFDPMREYVPFVDPPDLLNKVAYFLNHGEELDEIARRGHEKAVEQLDGRVFWGKLLSRIGLD